MMNEGQNQPSIEKQQKETLSTDSPFEFLTIFSVEYKHIADLFFGSRGLTKEAHEICQIVRIWNASTKSRYENEKANIAQRRNGGIIPG